MENLEEQIKELQKIVDTYDNIVFFGGAGVSTESGIPDFRSVDGLYHQQYDYPPETILSHSFYRSHPEEFFRFYRNKMLFPKAQPNAPIKSWRSWNVPERCVLWSRRISMDCIRPPEARLSWSFTARYCAITVKNAISSTVWMPS